MKYPSACFFHNPVMRNKMMTESCTSQMHKHCNVSTCDSKMNASNPMFVLVAPFYCSLGCVIQFGCLGPELQMSSCKVGCAKLDLAFSNLSWYEFRPLLSRQAKLDHSHIN